MRRLGESEALETPSPSHKFYGWLGSSFWRGARELFSGSAESPGNRRAEVDNRRDQRKGNQQQEKGILGSILTRFIRPQLSKKSDKFQSKSPSQGAHKSTPNMRVRQGVTMPIIPAPTNFRKVNSMKKFAWTYNSAFDSFEVFRPASGAGPELLLGTTSTLPTDAAPFVINDMPLGTYNVAVRAVRGTTKSAASNQVQVTVTLEAPSLLHEVE
jgi:hypothetical protein